MDKNLYKAEGTEDQILKKQIDTRLFIGMTATLVGKNSYMDEDSGEVSTNFSFSLHDISYSKQDEHGFGSGGFGGSVEGTIALTVPGAERESLFQMGKTYDFSQIAVSFHQPKRATEY
jgi:hypothetical protein